MSTSTSTYNIIDGIATLIERFIWFETPILETVGHCDDTVKVMTTRHFRCEDPVFIHANIDETIDEDLTEQRTITGITVDTLTFDQSFSQTYLADTATVARTAVAKIHRGEPPRIERYPVVTVNLVDMDQQPLTLGSIENTYSLEIKTFAEMQDYDKSYRWLHDITSQIIDVLTRVKNPLIQPFKQTTLAEDAAGSDAIIRLVDADFTFNLSEIYFDDGRFTSINRIKSNMHNGVYELVMPIGRPYSAGTAVFLPLFHVYWADVTGTTWDDATDGKRLLKTSTIDYEMKVAKVLR